MKKEKILIPFGFLPMSKLKRVSGSFIGVAALLERVFPNIGTELEQADLDIKPKEYLSIMALLFTIYFLLVFDLSIFFLMPFTRDFLPISFGLAFFLSSMILLQLKLFPRIRISRKVREIEKNLVFALRAMLIQLKSGVSLYYTMKIVAEGSYGVLSREFAKMIKEVDSGIKQEAALEKMARENPSPIFRRAVWQIVNGMKGGGDIEKIIRESLKSLARKQRIGVQKYGSQLKVLSLMYMMIGIIIPALGLVFLIVLGSFPKITITELIFWLLLMGIIIMEFVFIGLIKSKRPTLIGD